MNDLPEFQRDEIINRPDRMIKDVLEGDQDTGTSSRTGDYKRQIKALYFKVLEELLVQEEKKIHNQNFTEILLNSQFHKALIACCIETTFFVNNYTNEKRTFEKLLELCNTQPFEFWRIITSFVRFDPTMPTPIRKHIYELETKIIAQLAWKKDSQLHQLVVQLFEQNNENCKANFLSFY